MITAEEKALVLQLEKLDSKAKKGPWYPQGTRSKDKAVYRIGPDEEALIIALRNNIGVLLDIIKRSEK